MPNPTAAMVQRHQRKRAESPEDERMRKAGQRPLLNHLRLAQHLPEEVPYAPTQRKESEIGVFLRSENLLENRANRREKSSARAQRKRRENQPFCDCKVLRLGQHGKGERS